MTKSEKVLILGIFSPKKILMFRVGLKKLGSVGNRNHTYISFKPYYVIICLFVQHEESGFGLCICLQLLISGWCFQNCSLQALLHTYYINKISRRCKIKNSQILLPHHMLTFCILETPKGVLWQTVKTQISSRSALFAMIKTTFRDRYTS